MTKPLTVPDISLVVLIGASGSGKSTFARKHFKPTEVLSSDVCRGIISNDENSQDATGDAFELLHFIARKRLARGLLTVVDATNVQPESRKPLVTIAREFHALPVAIVLDVPEKVCQARNKDRPDRAFGPHVIRQQMQQLRSASRRLDREGFRHVFVLDSPEAIEAAIIERQPLWNNRKNEHGPFDIIGDVHGCFGELEALLNELGYVVTRPVGGDHAFDVAHPQGRKVLFVGDLVDRGPNVTDVLRLVMAMTAQGTGLSVPGNHDIKLMRKLRGKDVRITHGLAESLAQLEREPPEFSVQVADFIDGMVSHYVFDDAKLVVAHAGLKEPLQGRGSGVVREFALYGDTTGETDEYGLPVRYPWAQEYRGRSAVVYGHTPVPEPEWLNNTICIDTGCVFGGKLTALRWPERELVSVKAAHTYYEPAKPFLPKDAAAPALTDQQVHDDVLDLEDVLGKRIVQTSLHHTVTIREENANAALEVMSRFAVQPKWLIYLPPTMSPSETTNRPGLLEHPAEAFAYFRNHGVPAVVCEEKHMGSRAVIVLCRDEEAAKKHFGVVGEGLGVVVTRTGRPFFSDKALERALLERLNVALEKADLWARLETSWVCLDAELMPWSLKAQELLRGQYAAVGVAAEMALAEVNTVLGQAMARGLDVNGLAERSRARGEMAAKYRTAYRHYCWPVKSLAEVKLAPFHIMANDRRVHVYKDHLWHMETIALACAQDEEFLMPTAHRKVDLTDAASESGAVEWWEALTGRGGEGMVVKPVSFVARGGRGLLQPAIKCRGPEYLRIIYGPEYDALENLERLRSRGLGTKRSLALREFALGIEGLERFVRGEPLRRVHECVFGVLALESEPVDPRL
jgi:polynucleotide kinase-phosphatase